MTRLLCVLLILCNAADPIYASSGPAATPEGGGPGSLIASARELQFGDLSLSVSLEQAALAPDGEAIAYSTTKRLTIASRQNEVYWTTTSDAEGRWDPIWSPDGRSLIFIAAKDGARRIWVWNRDRNEVRQLSHVVIPKAQRVQWMPDGKAIVVAFAPLSNPAPAQPTSEKSNRGSSNASVEVMDQRTFLYHSGSAPQKTILAIIDLESGAMRPLLSGAEIPIVGFQLSPDGKKLAVLRFASERSQRTNGIISELEVVSIDGSFPIRTIAKIEQRFSAKNKVTWAPNGKMLAYVNAYDCTAAAEDAPNLNAPHSTPPQIGGDLFLATVDTGEIQRMEGAASGIFDTDADVFWDSAAKHVGAVGAGTCWIGSATTRQLTKLSLSLEARQILFSDDRRTFWSPDHGTTIYVYGDDSDTGENGLLEVNVEDGKSRVVWREMKKATFLAGGQNNGSSIIYGAESADARTDLWAAGTKFYGRRRLTVLNPQLEPYSFGKSMLISYQSASGERLHGALLLPAGYDPKSRYPLVVWVYASAYGSVTVNSFGLLSGNDDCLQMLATRGYAVLFPDAPVHLGTVMKDLADSVIPAVDRVIELKIADPERLGLMGFSNGGYSVLALATQTNRFRGAVAAAGFGDLAGSWISADEFTEGGGDKMGGPPWEVPERYVKNSPIYQLDKVTTPILLQDGSEDRLFLFGLQVYHGLRRLNRNVTFLVYKGEGHGLERRENQEDYWNRVIEFFGRTVKEPRADKKQ